MIMYDAYNIFWAFAAATAISKSALVEQTISDKTAPSIGEIMAITLLDEAN